MPKLPIRRLSQRLLALLLITTLSACIGTRREPFAPELSKSYVLTENLVQTSLKIQLPGLFQSRRNVDFAMTHEKYLFVKRFIDLDPLSKLGKVAQGNRVRVEQVFTYDDFHGDTRYGKLQFIDPATGAKRTAYSYLDDVGPKFREIK